ncbi:MAG: SRPBCC family protein [Betaproteobacteria bacterium]
MAAIVAVFLVIVALQPADFRIQRTALIAAPAQAVFAQVNDFRKWLAWSPWEKLDPELKRVYEGPPAGTGAKYAWAGNKNVGEGRMTIAESRPGELVRIKLEFFKPFAATHTAEFTFKPEGGGTAVTWSMTGRNSFMAKAMCFFVSMEKMVGGQFETGLANMKSIIEK